MAVLGGLVGLLAGTAFVGRAVVVVGGGGGLSLLGRGIAPSSLASDDSGENSRFLGAGLGGVGLRCGGVVVVDASPPLPPLLSLAHPAPSHAPPHLFTPPPPPPHTPPPCAV